MSLQDEVQNLLDRAVADGTEVGVQAVAYRDGERIVDAVAGVSAPGGPPVVPGTVFYNYSIGKGATATLVHTEVDRGAIGYETPVVELWPEFGAHGKENITVRHVLTHTAGVPGLPAGVTVADVCSWPTMITALEEADPWWEPGTRNGYHAYTFGYLAGEIVRRSSGQPLADLLRERISGPLGYPDELFFGMPADQRHRLATLVDAPSDGGDWTADFPPELPLFKAVPLELFPTAILGNDERVIGADIPAGAKTSARVIAKMYAALLGEVDGVRLISPERLRDAARVAEQGPDQVYGNEARWGLGYAVAAPWSEDSETTFGMAGAGGSWAGADPATGIAFALTKNVVSNDFDTLNQVARAVWGS